MKTPPRLVLSLLLTACLGLAGAELAITPFVSGPGKFKEGDAISIQQILATSPRLAPGDKVAVRGQYHLASREKATLCLFLTQTAGEGKESVAPTQKLDVKQGTGEFELTYEVKHAGVLHLTFYSIPDGKPFGGVYFGTKEQMAEIKDWTLSDYATNQETVKPKETAMNTPSVSLGYVVLYVKDVPASLTFYENAFGLSRRFFNDDNGKAYGELETGAARLAFYSLELARTQSKEFVAASPDKAPLGFEIALVTSDVPALYARAVKAGATVVSEPTTKPWGQTVACLRDKDGHTVGLCTPLP